MTLTATELLLPRAAIVRQARKIPRSPSALEERLWFTLNALKFPKPEREFRFHPERKWRFDFAYLEQKLGIECHGGIWTSGRHNRGQGFRDDCEKYTSAAVLGWRILHFTKAEIDDGSAAGWIKDALG